jgi:hypothetical protein
MPTASANLTGSTFEGNDGNLVVTTAGNTDWSNAPNRVRGDDLTSGSTDNSFGQGTKEDDPNVSVVTGSIPPQKSDLTRFYVGSEFVSNANFLYLAWERSNVLGSANMDFELNQSAQPNLTTTGAKTLVRTAGDVLITFDFTNGGGTPVLGLLKWVTTGANSQCFSANSVPCWGNRVNLSAAGFAEGAVNSTTVTDPIANVSLPGGTFGEAAINLSAAGVFPAGTCEALGSAFLKSRSSASFPAEVKDFVAPQPVNISNCGSVKIKKVDDAGTPLAGATFTLYKDNAPLGGSRGAEDTITTLTCTTAVTTGICTITNVPAGQYWVVETTTPTGYNTADEQHVVVDAGVLSDLTATPFVDPRQRGALMILKKSTKSGNPLVHNAGAVFSYGTGLSVTDNGAGDEDSTIGEICVSGLLPGNYTINETTPPSGYGGASQTNLTAVVVFGTDCAANEPTAANTAVFTNAPLSDIQVNFRDGGSTETSVTSITCTGGGTATTTVPSGWHDSLTKSGIAIDPSPKTITCTIVIDP